LKRESSVSAPVCGAPCGFLRNGWFRCRGALRRRPISETELCFFDEDAHRRILTASALKLQDAVMLMLCGGNIRHTLEIMKTARETGG